MAIALSLPSIVAQSAHLSTIAQASCLCHDWPLRAQNAQRHPQFVGLLLLFWQLPAGLSAAAQEKCVSSQMMGHPLCPATPADSCWSKVWHFHSNR
jgi:hypothetical protein